MKSTKKIKLILSEYSLKDFKEKLGTDCWNYIKTVVEIVREPMLVLDNKLNVIVANDPFYTMFQIDQKETEGSSVYSLGNGQWDIPELRKLLENILPKNTFFKDYEITHEFPFIGHKSMIINARRIHANSESESIFPIITFLAIEDITPMVAIAETLALHVKELANKNAIQTRSLQLHIEKLEREVKTNHKQLLF